MNEAAVKPLTKREATIYGRDCAFEAIRYATVPFGTDYPDCERMRGVAIVLGGILGGIEFDKEMRRMLGEPVE